MKRFLILIVIVALAVPALARQKQLDPAVSRALLSALSNERQAAARYEASAIKADQEGYRGAASLFRAAAVAERIHEARFVAALKEGGIDVPPSSATEANVGSTSENLHAAARAEIGERDGTYRDAYEIAQKANDPEIAKLFDQTRDAETEHGNLFTAAASNVNTMKNPHQYEVCRVCGYVTDLELPLCPSCRDQHKMQTIE